MEHKRMNEKVIMHNGLAHSAKNLTKNLIKGKVSEYEYINLMRLLLEDYERMVDKKC